MAARQQDLPFTVRVRQAVEKRIARRCIRALVADGYQLNIDNGGEEPELEVPSSDPQEVLDAMMETDDEYLTVFKDGKSRGWVRFVYGNSGWDVISDYTTNLEDALKPVNAFAETQEKYTT